MCLNLHVDKLFSPSTCCANLVFLVVPLFYTWSEFLCNIAYCVLLANTGIKSQTSGIFCSCFHHLSEPSKLATRVVGAQGGDKSAKCYDVRY